MLEQFPQGLVLCRSFRLGQMCSLDAAQSEYKFSENSASKQGVSNTTSCTFQTVPALDEHKLGWVYPDYHEVQRGATQRERCAYGVCVIRHFKTSTSDLSQVA